MRKRLIAAVFMIAAVVFALLSKDVVVFGLVGIMALFSVYEVANAFGFCNKEKWPICVYIMLFLPLLCLGLSEKIKGIIGSEGFTLIICFYIALGFFLALLFNEKVKTRDLFAALLISFIFVYFLTFMLRIRINLEKGKYLLWAVFVGACLTDSFAYFCGRFFGKRHLAPKISPNKTIEGAIGGLLGGIVSMLVYGLIIKLINPALNIHFGYLAILGFICAILAQIGDLSLSKLKREVGIKDFGNFIPGHGGMLDRLDSILFVAPAVYYFLYYFPCVS